MDDIKEGTALAARGLKRLFSSAVDVGASVVEWGTTEYKKSKRIKELPLHAFLRKQINTATLSQEYRVPLSKLQNIILNVTNNWQSTFRFHYF